MFAVGSEAYLALPKGGVVPDSHLLLVPIQHMGSLATAPEPLKLEVNKFLIALSHMFKAQQKQMVVFERVLSSGKRNTQELPQHTHLQILGVPITSSTGYEGSPAGRAQAVFQSEGAFRQIAFDVIGEDDDIASLVKKKQSTEEEPRDLEYLYVEVPDGNEKVDDSKEVSKDVRAHSVVRLLHAIPPGAKHPVQFGREVLCRLLQCPERLQWKQCAEPKEKEEELVEKVKKSFAPFDFTLETTK